MMRVKQNIHYKSFYVESEEETPLQSKEHIEAVSLESNTVFESHFDIEDSGCPEY